MKFLLLTAICTIVADATNFNFSGNKGTQTASKANDPSSIRIQQEKERNEINQKKTDEVASETKSSMKELDQTDKYQEQVKSDPDVQRLVEARAEKRYKVYEAKGAEYANMENPGDAGLTENMRKELKEAVANGEKEIASVRQSAAMEVEDKDAYFREAQKLAGECTWGVYDYDAPCSKSFYPVGPFCIPASFYKGPCKSRQNLTTMTWEQKNAWAASTQCADSFPCQPFYCALGTDYLTMCPAGWMRRANGFCEAPEEFLPPEKYFKANKCERLVQFGAYSIEMKERYEERCFVKWPCKGRLCRPDYSRNCPYNWEEKPDFICEASEAYSGPCPKFMNTTSLLLRADLKANLEFVCSVRWPCEVECNKDYDEPCPISWRHLGGGECLAPSFYKMPKNDVCRAKMSFGGLDPSVKEAFAQECRAPWPCLAPRNHCLKDYSSRCPIKWIDVGGKTGFCQPPSNYDGPCGARSFFSLKDDQKRKIESDCKVEWPCKGENWFALEFLHTDVDKTFKQDVEDEKNRMKAVKKAAEEEDRDGIYEQDFKYFLNVVRQLGFKDLDAFKAAGQQVPAHLRDAPLAVPVTPSADLGVVGSGPLRRKDGLTIVQQAPIFMDAKENLSDKFQHLINTEFD